MADIITLRPNGDNQVEWQFPPPPDHYTQIDEPLGTEPAGGYIFADKSDTPGIEDRWEFETQWNVLYVVQVDYGLFGALWKGPAGYNYMGIDVNLGGWLGVQPCDTWDNLSWKWHIESYTGLTDKLQTDLDAMLGAVILPIYDEQADQTRIHSVYIDVHVIWQECGRKINRRVNGRINDGLN